MKILNETSDFGKFWGPYMSRMRNLISLGYRNTNSIYEFVDVAYKNTPFEQAGSFDFMTLLSKIGKEIYSISPTSPAFAGCFLFTDSNLDIGVLLSNGSIIGVKNSGPVHFMSWQIFAPKYVWYLHL
jgi:hypothetical protein